MSVFLFSVLFSADDLIGKFGQNAKAKRDGDCGLTCALAG